MKKYCTHYWENRGILLLNKGHWILKPENSFDTFEEAQKEVEILRLKKIASLKKRLFKIERLVFNKFSEEE